MALSGVSWVLCNQGKTGTTTHWREKMSFASSVAFKQLLTLQGAQAGDKMFKDQQTMMGETQKAFSGKANPAKARAAQQDLIGQETTNKMCAALEPGVQKQIDDDIKRQFSLFASA